MFSFFFNDTATTEIYTLSLHDALPILVDRVRAGAPPQIRVHHVALDRPGPIQGDMVDRKSTRLNSSHQIISYAVFCLKKKNTTRKLVLPQAHPAMHGHHPPGHPTRQSH